MKFLAKLKLGQKYAFPSWRLGTRKWWRPQAALCPIFFSLGRTQVISFYGAKILPMGFAGTRHNEIKITILAQSIGVLEVFFSLLNFSLTIKALVYHRFYLRKNRASWRP